MAKPDRRKIADMRAAIYRTEHKGAPQKVFAQLSAEGTWQAVTEIKIVRGLLWVKLNAEGSSYMAHDVKLINELGKEGD